MKVHKLDCRHCAMVNEYHSAVELEREANGGWRNEQFRSSFTFRDWLITWNREQRIGREREFATAT